MFEEFFDHHSRIQSLRDGPEGPLLEGFAKELWQAGYARITARRHIRAAEHLNYWIDQEGIPISSLTEKLLDRFDRHLNQCNCPRYPRLSGEFDLLTVPLTAVKSGVAIQLFGFSGFIPVPCGWYGRWLD